MIQPPTVGMWSVSFVDINMTRFLSILFLACCTAFGATGTVKWATVLDDGGQMKICVEGLSTGGTYAFGLGSNNTITDSTAKLLLTVNSPGNNDPSGGSVSTNVTTRKIAGTAYYRKTFPNEAQAQEAETNVTDVVLWVMLSDFVAREDVLASVDIAAGFYTQGGNPNLAFSSASCTNESQLSLVQARPIPFWKMVPYQLVGNSITCKVAVAQYFGQLGRPVRAVEFWGVGTVSGATTAHGFATELTWFPDDLDATPIPVYAHILDCSGFTQGEPFRLHYKIHSWVGFALDTSDGVNTERDSDYGPLEMICNKNGTYNSGGFATLDPDNGNDGTGIVYSTEAAAYAGNKPYQTSGAAANAIGVYNNGLGTNTHQNGVILATNKGFTLWGTSLTSRSASRTWLTIKPRSDVPYGDVGGPWISGRLNSQTGNKTIKLKIEGIGLGWTSNDSPIDQGYGEVWLDRCWAGTNQGNAAFWVRFHTNLWVTRTKSYAWRVGLGNSVSQEKSFLKMWGNTFIRFGGMTNTSTWTPVVFAGNLIQPPAGEPQQYQFANDTDPLAINDPFFYGFNRMYGASADPAVYAMKVGINGNIQKGGALVQNVIEVSRHGSGIPFDIMASNKASEKCTNVLRWNNTTLGVTHDPFLIDAATNSAAAAVTAAWYSIKNNIDADLEMGADTKSATGIPGPPYNRWSLFYMVGSSGNTSAEIANGIFTPGGTINKWFNGLNFLDLSAGNVSQFRFVSNLSAYDGGGGSGNGNYRVQSHSPILTPGLAKDFLFKFDIEGNNRGAFDPPGAYSSANPKKGGFFF